MIVKALEIDETSRGKYRHKAGQSLEKSLQAVSGEKKGH